MDQEALELVAVAAEDERQLDGRRYLELVADHPTRALELALQIVVSRDGMVDEAELIVTGEETSIAVPLETPADVEELEPLELRLQVGSTELHLEQTDDGDFVLRIDLNRALLRSEATG